jgi:osomolarity two-component system response regulator SSK1
MEYFSEAAAKLGASPSSGLVIQSPSGQPAGIFFHPKGKSKSSNVMMERERGQFLVPSEQIKATTTRRTSNGKEPKSPHSPMTFSSLHAASLNPLSASLVDISSQESQPASTGPPKFKGKKPTSPQVEDTPVPASPRRASSISNNNNANKVTTPPASPQNETANASALPSRRNSRRLTVETKNPTAAKGPVDSNIVPPISVLIVDGMLSFIPSNHPFHDLHPFQIILLTRPSFLHS